MIVACRNEMRDHESIKEQETTYEKPLNDGTCPQTSNWSVLLSYVIIIS